jgi:hypothetical protein
MIACKHRVIQKQDVPSTTLIYLVGGPHCCCPLQKRMLCASFTSFGHCGTCSILSASSGRIDIMFSFSIFFKACSQDLLLHRSLSVPPFQTNNIQRFLLGPPRVRRPPFPRATMWHNLMPMCLQMCLDPQCHMRCERMKKGGALGVNAVLLFQKQKVVRSYCG